MRLRRAAVFAALFLCFPIPLVLAQDVTLRSRAGGVELSGTLLGYDGTFYRVDTIYGELTLDGGEVICEGSGCPDPDAFVADVSLSGSARVGSVMMPALIEAFARQEGYEITRDVPDATHSVFTLTDAEDGHPVAVFRLRVTTTDEGFADLLANEADIVMALRAIRPAEAARARDAGLGDLTRANRHLVLALDAIMPVVSPGNPVRAVSPQELAQIYTGGITNWSDLGGPNAPVVPYGLAGAAGAEQPVPDEILGSSGPVPVATILLSEPGVDLAAAVMADPSAIGLARFSDVTSAKSLTLSGSCGRPLRATRPNIKSGDYPLTAPVYLYLPARRFPDLARDFLKFVRSADAQLVIRRTGFVDLAPEEIPVGAQGVRLMNAILSAGAETPLAGLQRMMRVLAPMERLTTSFRFEPEMDRLDAQSRANIIQLAQAQARGQYDGRTLLFAGFSDGSGETSDSARDALVRAEAVRDAVLEAIPDALSGKVTIRTDAFGQAMPIACDDTPRGRQVNRRVEIWVR